MNHVNVIVMRVQNLGEEIAKDSIVMSKIKD